MLHTWDWLHTVCHTHLHLIQTLHINHTQTEDHCEVLICLGFLFIWFWSWTVSSSVRLLSAWPDLDCSWTFDYCCLPRILPVVWITPAVWSTLLCLPCLTLPVRFYLLKAANGSPCVCAFITNIQLCITGINYI